MHARASTSTNRGVIVQFVVLALIWGASFLFIAVALTGLSPVQVVLGRLLIGAVTLGLLCALMKKRLPRFGVIWAHFFVVSLLLCVVPFLLFTVAQQDISSGLASIYNATTPLMTALIALVALRSEELSRNKLFGVALGFAGVLVVLGPWNGVIGGTVLAQLSCLAATACYGAGFVYLRRFVTPSGIDAVVAATMQVGFGAVVMLLLAPAIALTPVSIDAPVIMAILALGALGTGIAYVWNMNVVTAWGATNASTVTYLTPVVGVTLGVLVLAEHIEWNQPVGAVIVIAGIAITHGRLKLPRLH